LKIDKHTGENDNPLTNKLTKIGDKVYPQQPQVNLIMKGGK